MSRPYVDREDTFFKKSKLVTHAQQKRDVFPKIIFGNFFISF
jgi:hypothetical protein